MEKIRSFLPVAVEWIKRTFAEIVSAPGIIWKWGDVSAKNRAIVVLGFSLAAIIFLAMIIYYIRIIAAKKRETPFTFFFISALICTGLWFARDTILKYQLPEAETVQAGGEDVLVYDRYSLAPGFSPLGEESSYMEPQWRIVDDIVTWRLDEGTILQLSGLRSLCAEHRYVLSAMEHDPQHFVKLSLRENGKYQDLNQTLSAFLELYIIPDRTLADEPWYLESGSSVRADSVFELYEYEFEGKTLYGAHEAEYRILENDGERIVFVADYGMYSQNALCVARQMGPDLVVGVSYAYASRWVEGASSADMHPFDPLEDPEEMSFLSEALTSLFDGRIRLIRDPSEALAERILPARIVSYPVPNCKTGDFVIPCRELLEMRESHYDESIQAFGPQELRFVGPGPDGREHLYSLVNGSSVYCNPTADEQIAMLEEWDAAYTAGVRSPDDGFSAYIGIKAVPYEDGWLLKVGEFFGEKPEYYYLSVVEELPAAAETAS